MLEATLLKKEAQVGMDSITCGTRSMVESGRQLMRIAQRAGRPESPSLSPEQEVPGRVPPDTRITFKGVIAEQS